MRDVRHDTTIDAPTIVFGAFDRHNFGDLLFPHVVSAMLPGHRLIYAGLAARDLRLDGGHQVQALASLAATWGDRPVNIIHAGGELLTCSAWQAAVMLLPSDEVQKTIARFEHRPEAALEWAHRQLGCSALAPYTLQRQLFPGVCGVIYNAVGGVDLDRLDAAMRDEVLRNLRAADVVSVRDLSTLTQLQAAGIAGRLMPDPAVMVAALFGSSIHQHALHGEPAQILSAFPQGYVAVQFSADFGDDATLQEISAQLDQVADATGLGVVFFRAGAAPWHDDLQCYQRVMACMRMPSAAIFTSLSIWDICALIAHSRVYCGSSLHGRIVAMAYALPRINLLLSAQLACPGKQAAYAAAWEAPGTPSTVEAHEIASGIRHALSIDPALLRQTASALIEDYRPGFDVNCGVLG